MGFSWWSYGQWWKRSFFQKTYQFKTSAKTKCSLVTKRTKIDTLLTTKPAEKPYPWGWSYLCIPYKGVPSSPRAILSANQDGEGNNQGLNVFFSFFCKMIILQTVMQSCQNSFPFQFLSLPGSTLIFLPPVHFNLSASWFCAFPSHTEELVLNWVWTGVWVMEEPEGFLNLAMTNKNYFWIVLFSNSTTILWLFFCEKMSFDQCSCSVYS